MSGQARCALLMLLAGSMLLTVPASAQGVRDGSATSPSDDVIDEGTYGEPPRRERCAEPSEPVGALLGHGSVSYIVSTNGRADLASLRVTEVAGMSEAGLLSAARRVLEACRYRPARQAGKAVPVRVTHRLDFESKQFSGTLAGPYEPGMLDEMAAPLRCGRVRVGNVTGRVDMEFTIGTDGKVERERVQVVFATSDVLRRAGLRLARSCTYAPAREQGLPVRIRVRQGFTF